MQTWNVCRTLTSYKCERDQPKCSIAPPEPSLHVRHETADQPAVRVLVEGSPFGLKLVLDRKTHERWNLDSS